MNILITGSDGQLGSEIRELSKRYKLFNFIFKDLPELDICNYEYLENFIIEKKIKFVINCAAFTAVDKAEENIEISEKVNYLGVKNLTKSLSIVGGKLIHISTDYVFNGKSFLPYKENDHVDPIGVYGKSKRKGELVIINSNIDAIIIRTSWLYSSYGNNFLKKMISLAKSLDSIDVIFDQIGTPTYARDLALVCLDIINEKGNSTISCNGRLYHYSNEGVASWYDFAKEIMNISKINCKINPISTEEYKSLARRPHYSVLSKTKIKKDYELEIPHWKDSLKECLKKID